MKKIAPMSEPFENSGQYIFYIVALFFFLSLPFFSGKLDLVNSAYRYPNISTNAGPYSFINDQIYKKSEDIDILFLGDSLMQAGLNAKQIEDELSKELGRKAVVVNLASSWRGEDMYFYILRDVLQNRKVKMLIFDAPSNLQNRNEPHVKAYNIVKYGENKEEDLSFFHKSQIYATNILGLPKYFVGLVVPLSSKRDESVEPNNGSLELAWNYKKQPSEFIPFSAKPLRIPQTGFNFQSNPALFAFDGQPTTEFQTHFIKLLDNLCLENNIPITLISFPTLENKLESKIRFRLEWDKVLKSRVSMVGIAPNSFLENYSEDEKKLFYYDDAHLNKNGSKYFTESILPTIIQLYREQININN